MKAQESDKQSQRKHTYAYIAAQLECLVKTGACIAIAQQLIVDLTVCREISMLQFRHRCEKKSSEPLALEVLPRIDVLLIRVK